MADDGRGIGAEEEFQSLKGVEGGLSYDRRDARVRESLNDFVGGGHVGCVALEWYLCYGVRNDIRNYVWVVNTCVFNFQK